MASPKSDSSNRSVTKDKVDQLNQQAWDIRVSDSLRADEISRQALELAQKTNYESGQAVSLKIRGFVEIRKANFNDALEILAKCHLYFLKQADYSNLAIVHEYFGISYRGIGEFEKSLYELYKALEISRVHAFKESECLILYHLSITYKYLGDLSKALKYNLEGLPIARSLSDRMPESYHLNTIGSIYLAMDDLDNSLKYYQESLRLREDIGDLWGQAGSLDNIGRIFLEKGDFDQALVHCSKGYELAQKAEDRKGMSNTLFHIGQIHLKQSNYSDTLTSLERSLTLRISIADKRGVAEVYTTLGELYSDRSWQGHNNEQALFNLNKSLEIARDTSAKDIECKSRFAMSKIESQLQNFEQAYKHLYDASLLEKEIISEKLRKEVMNLQVTHRVSQAKNEAELLRSKNQELAELIAKVEEKNIELEETLGQLQATQKQLIHAEKMASLGELTAGIAHEIQNPLNFVNNFSDVSGDLLVEIEEEMADGNLSEVQLILSDLKSNLGKINHHGLRASNIVQSMLAHSHTRSEQKEPIDINKMVDEYLRLAYHGMRAKDKKFQAEFSTDLDPDLKLVSVVSQDIGRVILNVISNAFHACSEKSRSLMAGDDNAKGSISNYQPLVVVSTMASPFDQQLRQFAKPEPSDVAMERMDYLHVSVKDNGVGMPPEIVEKMFQPFFTTKPTGEGTGLGLSISYDIITKGHGGMINVESTKAEGTTVVISIPYV